MSVESDITKARKRPMDLTKMRELLTKLRKGATATLSFGKLLQVLIHLGWKVDSIVDWTPRQYVYQGKEYLPSADTIRFGSREALEARRAELQAVELDGLPSHSPHVGQVAVAEVQEIVKGAPHRDSYVYYFHWREWVGTEGLAVTSPAGVFEGFLPDHNDLDRGNRSLFEGDSSTVGDVWRWLKENGIEDSINSALGTEKHVPAAERTRENTGTCPACWGNYKLSNVRQELVMHGYERPGYGFLKGQCFCVGMPPLETSDEGARNYRRFLAENIDREKKFLARLQADEVEMLQGYGERVVKKGEPAFERLLEASIDRTEYTIKQLTADVKFYGKVLAAWEPRPMPRQGELQRSREFFVPRLTRD